MGGTTRGMYGNGFSASFQHFSRLALREAIVFSSGSNFSVIILIQDLEHGTPQVIPSVILLILVERSKMALLYGPNLDRLVQTLKRRLQ